MEKRDSDITFAIGFTIGVALGISLAFILSPLSGEETRDLLKEKVNDAKGTVREVVGDRKKIYTEAWEQPRVKPYTIKLA